MSVLSDLLDSATGDKIVGMESSSKAFAVNKTHVINIYAGVYNWVKSFGVGNPYMLVNAVAREVVRGHMTSVFNSLSNADKNTYLDAMIWALAYINNGIKIKIRLAFVSDGANGTSSIIWNSASNNYESISTQEYEDIEYIMHEFNDIFNMTDICIRNKSNEIYDLTIESGKER